MNLEKKIHTPINRILFVGWSRAGKDEAATLLSRITALKYGGSTSWAALPFMADHLGLHPQVSWETRHSRRKEWFEHCCRLRESNQSFLVERALEAGDIVTGVRDFPELCECRRKELFDRIVWIDRPGTPGDSTLTYTAADCDEVIHNDGTLEQFHQTLFDWAVENRLPLRRTPETENLFRTSRFYAWRPHQFEVGNE